ncbi:hypothetical protein A4X06_0g4673 [Tilletia controversa]|uniref:Uncharacterized protein n=1 Tax=Tilletia controversa TaxID=13291 RepID=A0A8X7MT90_9BASI|nr:hypothetical protein A4X06_0g4673 [Tilletia controversa]
MERGADGRFDYVKLADLIKDARAKTIDVLQQIQAIEVFKLCTLNEFCACLELQKLESSDPAVGKSSELPHVHIDNLELHPGLLAQESKPTMPGSGLCPCQTIGRAIVDDAVSLIRTDSVLSMTSASPHSPHGDEQLQSQGGAYNGILSTLLFRVLPGAFIFNSNYALLPFYTHALAKQILKDNGKLD